MFVSALYTAFPDLQLHIEDTVLEGEELVVRWSAQGTQTGEFIGISPTGRKVSLEGIAIDRFENGKVVELWQIYYQLSMLQQLGVIPAPGG